MDFGVVETDDIKLFSIILNIAFDNFPDDVYGNVL